jgi:hypothetical protein
VVNQMLVASRSWSPLLLLLLLLLLQCRDEVVAQCIDSRAHNYDPAASSQGQLPDVCQYGIDSSSGSGCALDPATSEACSDEQVLTEPACTDVGAVGSCDWTCDAAGSCACQPAQCQVMPALAAFVEDAANAPGRASVVAPRLTVLQYTDVPLTACCASDGCCESCCNGGATSLYDDATIAVASGSTRLIQGVPVAGSYAVVQVDDAARVVPQIITNRGPHLPRLRRFVTGGANVHVALRCVHCHIKDIDISPSLSLALSRACFSLSWSTAPTGTSIWRTTAPAPGPRPSTSSQKTATPRAAPWRMEAQSLFVRGSLKSSIANFGTLKHPQGLSRCASGVRFRLPIQDSSSSRSSLRARWPPECRGEWPRGW